MFNFFFVFFFLFQTWKNWRKVCWISVQINLPFFVCLFFYYYRLYIILFYIASVCLYLHPAGISWNSRKRMVVIKWKRRSGNDKAKKKIPIYYINPLTPQHVKKKKWPNQLTGTAGRYHRWRHDTKLKWEIKQFVRFPPPPPKKRGGNDKNK